MWRLFQLDKGLSKDGARWAKFGSGNWESLMQRERNSPQDAKAAEPDDVHPNGHLPTAIENGTAIVEPAGNGVNEAGREVRAILLDWYAKHYSANRMTLAVYGKGALESLHMKIFPLVHGSSLDLETPDELTAIITELFSPVPDRKLLPLYTESSPVPPLNSPWGAAEEGVSHTP